MVSLAENARVPVDNPATHLELTMIHEALILEYSGRHLALMEWAAALKLFAYSCAGLALFFPWGIAEAHDHSAIRTLSNRNRLLLVAFIAAVTLVVGTLISRIHLILPQVFDHPATYPYIDTFIAISSILATILLARRIFETWVLWIAVDITSIGLYSVKGVKLIALEFVIFLALAVLGIYSWYRLWRQKSVVSSQ